MTESAATPQSSSDETAVREVVERINKAHLDKDAAAIMANHTDDALLFNLAPPLAHHGIDGGELQAWLDTWDGPVQRESRDFEYIIIGDNAFGHGYIRIGGQSKNAGRLIEFWTRATLFLRRENGTWRVSHEHTSVPMYMKMPPVPAFDLKP